MIATGLCIVGVAFWTLPGGIIGSGFALKVEQKNKKKQFNRLLPAAASLIQTWWRMKATLQISTSNTSCLIATVSTFDISKSFYSTSLRRLKKHFDASSSSHYNTRVFYGLDAKYNSNNDLSKNTENNENGEREREKESTEKRSPPPPPPTATSASAPVTSSSAYFLNTAAKDVDFDLKQQRRRTLTFGGASRASNSSANVSHGGGGGDGEGSSILLQLSPEHLILIRTILLLKYFAAKNKFKQAFKPYDFKDVIEQYTQGNMDILHKMKDLQRKMEQMSAQAYHASASVRLNSELGNYSGGSPITQRSYSPNLTAATTSPTIRLAPLVPFAPDSSAPHTPKLQDGRDRFLVLRKQLLKSKAALNNANNAATNTNNSSANSSSNGHCSSSGNNNNNNNNTNLIINSDVFNEAVAAAVDQQLGTKLSRIETQLESLTAKLEQCLLLAANNTSVNA